jgi:hypothetical protein
MNIKFKIVIASFFVLLLQLQNVQAGVKACTQVDQHIDPKLGGMSARIQRIHQLPKNPGQEYLELLNADSNKLIEIANSLIDFRIESAERYHQLDRIIVKDKPISPKHIDELLQLEARRQSYTKTLRALIEKYRCEMFKYDLRAYESAKGFWAYRMSALLLSAHALMSDNLITYALIIQHNPTLRHVLNAGAKTYGLSAISLEREMSQHFAIIQRDDWEWSIDVFHIMLERRALFPSSDTTLLKNFDLMMEIIRNSVTYKKRISQSYFTRIIEDVLNPLGQRIKVGHLIEDTFYKSINQVVYSLSEAFGRTIAQIQWKDGVMYNRPDLEKTIVSKLRPGDIFWDKTRHKVSGKLIPGFWNHNAIWIGTKQELQEMEIWDHDYIRPHQKEIENGKSIVEALRFGVVLNTMAHFLNVDDLAVARPVQEMSLAERRDLILRSMRYVDTPYSFNFDIARADAVICSQLVMISYTEIDWKQEKLIGNWSTTPDLLARETLAGGPLQITQLYLKGELIEQDPQTTMQKILNKKIN